MNKPLIINGSYYNAEGAQICSNAYHALYAATLKKQVGRWAALRYAMKRGVLPATYRLACQLVAVQMAEEKDTKRLTITAG